MKSVELADESAAKTYYDQRFHEGYMEEWPAWKVDRVRNLCRQLPLPKTGTALDFGCGQGVFTAVLKEALPGWKILGCDLSEAAILAARSRNLDATFFMGNDPALKSEQIDLVFTHHVLEHVLSLRDIVTEMTAYARPPRWMLHILPCGNAGSAEHHIALLTKNGIEADRGNRFYFEDPGHLRRLTSQELQSELAHAGYLPADAWFANQTAGAWMWISGQTPEFIREFANPNRGVTQEASVVLNNHRNRLLRLQQCRKLARRGIGGVASDLWRAVRALLGACGKLALLPVAMVVDWSIRRSADREWEQDSKNPAGSEMYLLFEKPDA